MNDSVLPDDLEWPGERIFFASAEVLDELRERGSIPRNREELDQCWPHYYDGNDPRLADPIRLGHGLVINSMFEEDVEGRPRMCDVELMLATAVPVDAGWDSLVLTSETSLLGLIRPKIDAALEADPWTKGEPLDLHRHSLIYTSRLRHAEEVLRDGRTFQGIAGICSCGLIEDGVTFIWARGSVLIAAVEALEDDITSLRVLPRPVS